MKVLTTNPIVINDKKINTNDVYLSIDGTEGKEIILKFQQWVNSVKKPATKLAESGTWDEPTKAAAVTYGAEFDAQKKKGFDWDKAKGWINTGANVAQQTGFFDYLKNQLGWTTSTPTSSEGAAYQSGPSAPTVDAEAEKKKKRNRTIMIVGGVIVAGVIIYLLVRNKNKSK